MKRFVLIVLCVLIGGRGLARAQDGDPAPQPITPANVAYLVQLNTLDIGEVLDVAFSPDGTHLATAGPGPDVRIYDVSTGEVVQVLRGHRADVQTDDGSDETALVDVHSVAYSPDGTMLVSASTLAVRLWDLDTGREYAILTGYEQGIDEVVFSPDGTRLAFGLAGETARIWDIEQRWTTAYIEAYGRNRFSERDSLAFSPDGAWLMLVTAEETVGGWHLENERFYGGIGERYEGFSTLAFSPDLRWFVAGYDLPYADPKTSMVVSDGLLVEHYGYVDADRWITRLVFNHAGSLLAGIEGSYAGTNGVTFWDTADPRGTQAGYFRQVYRLQLADRPSSAAFSPDDRWLAISTGTGVELWGVPADTVIPPTPTPTATVTPGPTNTPRPTPGPFELSQTPPYHTPTPSQTPQPPTVTPTVAQTPVLAPGGRATVHVESGDLLNVRATPDITGDILARLADGAVVDLLDGPLGRGGYRWWRVRTADGIEGWAVEVADDVQTLVPVG